jgi:CheY-like chemotaxis protein
MSCLVLFSSQALIPLNRMNKNGPIIIIEDDSDDQDLISEIFTRLNYQNEIMFFSDGLITLDYLIRTEVRPFLIISDINLPKLNGIELREKVHNNEQLRLRCIPYLFLTSSVNHRDVIDAYSKSVQGFFIKPDSLAKFELILKKVVEYWQECMAPNKLS